MSNIEIRAGKEAYEKIRKEGLQPSMISAVVAAAGGPKWFTTYGLTRYLLAEFLQPATQPIHFLGSSVGSWQMACGITADPGASIDRLQQAYCNMVYTDAPDSTEISLACSDIIQTMLGKEDQNILHNANRHLHVMTARGKGWLSSSSKVLRGSGFAYAFLLNAMNRRLLSHSVERVVFSNSTQLPYQQDYDALPTRQISLNTSNLLLSLRASGSIPFMMDGITDIPGAGQGAYWDGGITDYHIALPFNVEGLVLQPHFLPYVLQGWLDKKLPWQRRATEEQMSKVILITPSQEYVDSLPRRQISDLSDFKFYGLNQQSRIDYWSKISSRSHELGEELRHLISTGTVEKIMQPY